MSVQVETEAKGMRQKWCPLLSQEATMELLGGKLKVIRDLMLAVGNQESNCSTDHLFNGPGWMGDQGRANR